jgi:hypothetical protein
VLEVELASSVLCQHIIVLPSWEGGFPEDQKMEYDANTKEVTNAAILSLGVL